MINVILPLIFFPIYSPVAPYLILFVILIISGLGLPVPEEATLILGGYLAYLGFLDYCAILYVLIAGIIAADLVGYVLGRFAGDFVFVRLFHRSAYLRHLLERGRHYADTHGEKVVILSRIFVGVRVAVPILMGHFRMNAAKFILYDLLATVPWTIAIVSLSYYLGSGFTLILQAGILRRILFIVFGAGIVAFFAVHYLRHKKMREIRQ